MALRPDGQLENMRVEFEDEGDEGAFRKRLGRVFQDCVLGRLVYESLAAPWETIEEALPPGPEEAAVWIGLTPRGRLARALKNIRNRRVHGLLDRDSFNGHDGRRVAILQLLFLVDLLEGKCMENRAPGAPTGDRNGFRSVVGPKGTGALGDDDGAADVPP